MSFSANTGAVAEQFIGQHLLYASEYCRDIRCARSRSAAAEADYLLPIGQGIVPIEIKSGATLRCLHQFCREKQRRLRFGLTANYLLLLRGYRDNRQRRDGLQFAVSASIYGGRDQMIGKRMAGCITVLRLTNVKRSLKT